MKSTGDGRHPVIPVVLSGGSGERLWPSSRKTFPKQLHTFYGDKTMLQHTCTRLKYGETPIVICNEDQRFTVAEQLRSVGIKSPTILLEPAARNTAPAMALAALTVLQKSKDAILVILPADHQITDLKNFNSSVDIAVEKATEGQLIVFGVKPASPDTGFGYIHAELVGEKGGPVLQFKEKPDLETAEEYLKDGSYYWNSGILVGQAKQIVNELKKFEPEIINACEAALKHARKDFDFIRVAEEHFKTCKSTPMDIAVLEQSDKVWCVPLASDWSDLGSWQSLWQASDKDDNGNALFGDVWNKNCQNTLVKGNKKLIAALGTKNLAIVDTDDVLLVADLDQSQDVKEIVKFLKSTKRSEVENHKKVHRPWGSYYTVDEGDRFQVKRIEVKPGASLSLQMHHHRAEHWTVVVGTAIVQRGEEEILLSENQSVYIPLGEKHRLTNPGKVLLQLIEVQSGAYLGEDDIVRFDDEFGRES